MSQSSLKNNSQVEMKTEQEMIENASAHKDYHHNPDEFKHGDQALAVSEERVLVTDADSRRIARAIDKHLLPILAWIYFLQILDKTVVGYAAIYGLKSNTHLVGNQYSNVGSIGYYAQLAAQPLGAFLLVKYPIKWTMPIMCFCWGASQCGLAGAHNYGGLLGARFMLGWWEACCLPLFAVITISWYRRSEQPWRVAIWYGTNGAANFIGAPLVYGLGHIKSTVLYSYQIIFLTTGLLTVVTAVIIYFMLDNSVMEARFLSPEDRIKGVERLRSNNQGVTSTEFKWRQVLELMIEPKFWIFLAMTFFLNVGSSISTIFGPLIIQGLVGFDAYTATLLDIPFGALQTILILGSCWLSQKYKRKSVILAGTVVPVIIGLAILWKVPRVDSNKGPLLLGFYLIAFLYASLPLIVAWMGSNVSGHSKKTAAMCGFNGAQAAGHFLGPQLFKASQAPQYLEGLKATMCIFCVLLALVGVQVLNLRYLNKKKEKLRVRNGKKAKLEDLSMEKTYVAGENDGTGEKAFLDLTDKENDEFVYVY